jgi:hypothetical protein
LVVRRLTALALAVLLVGGASGVFHARAADLCDLPPAPHDASAHRWAAQKLLANEHGEHCYLCHWLRSIGSTPELAGRLIAGDHSSDRVRPGDILAQGLQGSFRLPARSPPGL